MNRTQAYTVLNLSKDATEAQVRSQFFKLWQHWSEIEIADEPQSQKLNDLITARDLLLGSSESEKQEEEKKEEADHLLAGAQLTLIGAEEDEDLQNLPEEIAVLLYQKYGQEGIHTLRFGNDNVVLAFENSFTARRYSQALAKRDLPKPAVENFFTQEIVDFCRSSGHGLLLVPSDQFLEPPDAVDDDLKGF
ncbi:MAG: DUF3110 domain-containing protein [Gloeobacterales cyanobacterium]